MASTAGCSPRWAPPGRPAGCGSSGQVRIRSAPEPPSGRTDHDESASVQPGRSSPCLGAGAPTAPATLAAVAVAANADRRVDLLARRHLVGRVGARGRAGSHCPPSGHEQPERARAYHASQPAPPRVLPPTPHALLLPPHLNPVASNR